MGDVAVGAGGLKPQRSSECLSTQYRGRTVRRMSIYGAGMIWSADRALTPMGPACEAEMGCTGAIGSRAMSIYGKCREICGIGAVAEFEVFEYAVGQYEE
jgi:hypothetical protein